tara:strand:+ start:4997 stop:5593 length:597 start_codon:yes stop_codon:yes gene_type:complete
MRNSNQKNQIFTKKYIRIFIFLFIPGIFYVSYYFYSLNDLPKIKVGNVSIVNTDADIKLDDIHVIENSKGYKEWELWAETAKTYQAKDLTVFSKIKMKIYKDNTFWELYANKGSLVISSRDVLMSGNVVIKSNSGLLLKTQSISFKTSSNTLFAKSEVFIEGDDFKVNGYGLEGNIRKGSFTIKEKVVALLNNKIAKN